MEKQNEKEMKKVKKNEKGITLIALVITVIVLLILVAVSIATLTGQNGILTRANEAREKTETAQEIENVTLERYEDAIDYVLGTEVTGVDASVTNPIGAMPTGATVIQGDASEGIVIRDENENEWVWVEVPRTAEVYPTAGTDLNVDTISDEQYTIIYEDLENYADAYRQDGYEDTFYSIEQAGFSDPNAYNQAKNNMLKSVYKYGGFWIGRYEVGDADATISNTVRTKGTGTSNTAVIKANQVPYNYVTCRQAQELTTGLSTGGKTSSLMFGIQGDLICKFLEVKTDLNEEDINADSTNWGNYSNSTIILSQGKYNASPSNSSSQWLDIIQGNKSSVMLLTTGASKDTNKMNIYDFAGNVYEWTLEYTSYTDYPCTSRGGDYDYSGSGDPAYIRTYNNTTTSYNNIGFRPSLF